MKRILLILLLSALILTSCQGSSRKQTPGAEIINEATSTLKPATATESPLLTEIPATPTQTDKELASVPAGCTVISPRPTPGPTEQSIFPPVGDSDWVYGPDSAAITIMEYSDFQ